MVIIVTRILILMVGSEVEVTFTIVDNTNHLNEPFKSK